MTALEDKLTSFGQFLTLLSGQLDVRVTTKDNPLPNALVLPELNNIDETDLDVLYGLCLREAGTIAKSQKRTEFLRRLKTKRELQAATLIDQGRTERFLSRRFGGAGDILLRHFGVLAHQEKYQRIVFGLDPKTASADQVFLYAFKWHMLGCPKFGWEKIFPQDQWQKACSVIEEHGNDLLSTPLRKYEDAIELSQSCLALWYDKTSTQDESAYRGTSKEEKAYEQAVSEVEQTVQQKARDFQDKIDALKEQLKTYRKQWDEKKEEMKDVVGPLEEKLKELSAARARFSKVQQELLQTDRLSSLHDKVENKLEKTQGKATDLSQKKEELKERVQASVDTSSFEEKMQKLQEELLEKRQNFDKAFSSLEERRAQLEKMLSEETNSSKQEALQKKVTSVEQRMSSLQASQEQVERRAQEKQDQLNAKQEEYFKRQEEKKERLNERAHGVEEKMQEINKKLQDFDEQKAQLERDLQQANQDLQKAMAEAQVKNLGATVEEMVENMQKTRQEHQQTQQDYEKVTKPLEALKEKMSQTNKQATDLARAGRWETEKALRAIEKKLAQQGVDIELTEKMEEMEGWDAANQAQAQFDEKASNELQQSVINGQGQGRGSRDMMMLIEDTLSAIHEVDPNTIFEDVQKLSPLSGFAQGPQSGPNEVLASSSVQESAFVSKAHTVWSKKFDRVIPAPVKKLSLAQELRAKNAKDIAQVKKMFVAKMKPSFKPKFVGNKEEGDLDSRNLWKFAANQGDDFFEVTKKRPVNKSSASILVDLSGSMEGSIDEASKHLQKLVLLLSEGFTACHIPHEILGYYAPVDERLSAQDIPQAFNRKSCRLETVVIKDFKEKDLSGLASLVLQQADNSDGESLRVGLQRLLRQNGANKMMFVVSDGKPYMQDADCDVLDADLHRALLEAVQKKVVTAGLGFAPNHPVLGSAYIAVDEKDMVKSLENLFGGQK